MASDSVIVTKVAENVYVSREYVMETDRTMDTDEWLDWTFRPDRAVVTFFDDQFSTLVVTGKRVLTDGTLGRQRGRQIWYRHEMDDIPDWLTHLISPALGEETPIHSTTELEDQ